MKRLALVVLAVVLAGCAEDWSSDESEDREPWGFGFPVSFSEVILVNGTATVSIWADCPGSLVVANATGFVQAFSWSGFENKTPMTTLANDGPWLLWTVQACEDPSWELSGTFDVVGEFNAIGGWTAGSVRQEPVLEVAIPPLATSAEAVLDLPTGCRVVEGSFYDRYPPLGGGNLTAKGAGLDLWQEANATSAVLEHWEPIQQKGTPSPLGGTEVVFRAERALPERSSQESTLHLTLSCMDLTQFAEQFPWTAAWTGGRPA